MTSRDLDTDLLAVLGAPMTDAQRASLDDRLRQRRSAPGVSPRRLPLRRAALLAAAALLATATLAGVSGAIHLTEDPQGLTSAGAFQAEIDAAKAVVPIPAAATWPPYLAVTGGVSYSNGGGRTWVETVAFCLWTQSWLDARAKGDAATARIAAGTIATVPTWPGYRGEFTDQSMRDALDVVIAGVAAADPAPAEQFVGLNCQP